MHAVSTNHGWIEVPDESTGCQTRAPSNIFASVGSMPLPMIHALAGQEVALVNAELGVLDPAVADLVVQAADEVIAGRLDEHIFLGRLAAGSGTQST